MEIENAMNPLGDDLLKNEDFNTYELTVYDGKYAFNTQVNRDVLAVSSPFLARATNGKYYYSYTWVVPRGYVPSALRLVKYFYTRDPADLGDLQRTRELCQQLECKDLMHALDAFLRQEDQVIEEEIPHLVKHSSQKRRLYNTRSMRQMVTRSHKRSKVY